MKEPFEWYIWNIHKFIYLKTYGWLYNTQSSVFSAYQYLTTQLCKGPREWNAFVVATSNKYDRVSKKITASTEASAGPLK